jgi:hypothetical protein
LPKESPLPSIAWSTAATFTRWRSVEGHCSFLRLRPASVFGGTPDAGTQAHVWEQRSQHTTELCEASTKLHFLSAALWWYLFAFVMPGIGECKPPLPEGPFPLSQSSRAQGLQEVGQRPVQRTVKRKLVEAIVSQAGEEL